MIKAVRRRFVVALALSVAAHFLLVAEAPVLVPKRPQAMEPRRAELLPPPAREAAPPPPPPVARPPSRPRPPARAPVAVAAPTPDRPVVALPPEPPDASATPAIAEAGVPEPPAPTAEPLPEPAVTAKPVDPPKPSTGPPAIRALPAQGRITYLLFLGDNKLNIGRSVNAWHITGETYRLSTEGGTTGLASLFRPYQLNYVSEGTVAPEGLRPSRFAVRRGPSGDSRLEASFDWAQAKATFRGDGGERAGPLPAGTQDLVSFMFQFGLAALPAGRFTMPITNGSRIERYEFEVGAEETLETPLGALRTIPVRRLRKTGEEGQEIWLAIEYRYLPVRVRLLDRQGNMSGEQMVSEISVGPQ